MKRIFIFFASFLSLSILPLYSEEMNSYDYANVIYGITKVEAPHIQDGFIVFTEKNDARNIGIVFDFEGYKIIHPFQIHENHNIKGDVTFSCFCYLLEVPENISVIKYRLIIDGLWTTDPLNENTFYDTNSGITLSQMNLPVVHTMATLQQPDGTVHFVYKGKTGRKITLGGNFTNWDPSIYQLTEIKPGIYELDLALAPGTYYYSYYYGITPLLDNTNRHHAYREDGRQISVINVKSID